MLGMGFAGIMGWQKTRFTTYSTTAILEMFALLLLLLLDTHTRVAIVTNRCATTRQACETMVVRIFFGLLVKSHLFANITAYKAIGAAIVPTKTAFSGFRVVETMRFATTAACHATLDADRIAITTVGVCTFYQTHWANLGFARSTLSHTARAVTVFVLCISSLFAMFHLAL